MNRRELLALASAAILPGANPAAGSGGPSVRYRDYSRCLPDYLRTQAEQAYQRRNRALAGLTSHAAIQERQRWVAETFWNLTGGMPRRTPLNARTVGVLKRPGYRLEKVVYESQPGLHIPANLYVPTSGRPPFPGVLVQMGHTPNGKAGYQRICQTLATLGYLTLGFDPMGQGERTYYPGEKLFRSRLGADEEHTRPGRQMLLFGDTSTRLQVWDSIRSLDYLAEHPLVDPKRLASTGQSGGGTNTMLLAAVDDRLAVAAVSCGNTENVACAGFNPPGSTDDGEQNLIASGPAGFDRWDLLYPLAPKPLLVLASDRDFFGTYSPNYLTSGLEEFAKLKRVYETLGVADRLEWFGTPLPHGLAYDMRLAIYNWLGRWLKGDTRTITEEPDLAPEAEADLFVASSGSVVRTFAGETPFSLNCKRTPGRTPARLEELLRLERPAGKPVSTLARASFLHCTIDAVEFESAAGVQVPAWLYAPKQPDAAAPLVVVVEPNGRAAWHEGELYDQLARRGAVVCAPDLRGQGDLSPEFPRHASRSAREHADEESWAWSALILGRPLAGQRVADLMAVIAGLRQKPGLRGRRLILAARGTSTVPALFAAVLEPTVDALYLAGGLISFESVVQAEDYQHPFANFVPGLLLHTDLPALASGLAPRPVVVAGAVDGAGRRLRLDRLREAYKAAGNIRCIEEHTWDPGSILRA